jgi:Mrp family chromosome partitioning ATPase
MSRKLAAPVFGAVENMSALLCRSRGQESHRFRSGSVERDVPFLGGVPLVNAA